MLAAESSLPILQNLTKKYLTELARWDEFNEEYRELLACVANALTMVLGIDVLSEAIRLAPAIKYNHSIALALQEAGLTMDGINTANNAELIH